MLDDENANRAVTGDGAGQVKAILPTVCALLFPQVNLKRLSWMVCVCFVAFGGFFLACEAFGRMFEHSFPACAFLFKVQIKSRTPFHSLGQDQSTVAQRAETTVCV